MKTLLSFLSKFSGLVQIPVSHSEKLISALGGFVALFVIMLISQTFLSLENSLAVVASIGASAVLLFAVPNGPLSQPWPVLGSHLLAAFIGVSCALLITDPIIAASLAVGLTIAAMYYLNCLHPPGGATALTAVIGGDAIHQLGYQFILTPVLLNVVAILLIAVLFNSLFDWRRYPAAWRQNTGNTTANNDIDNFCHEDFLAALKQIDSFVDVNEQELQRIFQLASSNARKQHLAAEQIKLGKIYSNGQVDGHWSMRQIIDQSSDTNPDKDYVIFKQIAGQAPKRTDCVTRQEFAAWAKYEMVKQNGRWLRASE